METLQVQIRSPYSLYERVALAINACVFVWSLLTNSLHWSGLYDLAFLLAGIYLVAERSATAALLQSKRQGDALLVCLYLFVDSLLTTAVLMGSLTILLFVYSALACLYGAALIWRLKARGTLLRSLQWSRLLQLPYVLLFVGALLALLSMYLPMIPSFYGFRAWSGPMVMYLPGTMHMSAGRMLNIGTTVMVPGYAISFGHLVCLLLAGLMVLTLVQSQALVSPGRWRTLSRIVAVLVLSWWLFVAKGLHYLHHWANFTFAAGLTLLLIMLFRVQKAGDVPGTPVQKP